MSTMETLIGLTESLTRVLRQENELLTAHKVKEAAPLTAEKSRLGTLLQLETDSLRRQQDRVRQTTPTERTKLQQVTELFHAALAENGRLLGVLRKITENLVQTVAEEALRQTSPLQSYGENGSVAVKSRGAATLAINQVI